jgi:hypothetical protein
VAESKAVEDPDCESGHRGFESFRSPQASVAQRRPHSAVDRASHTEVRVLPGALHVPVAQWRERIVPDDEVIRSSRIGDAMARDSPGERRSAKPPDGFDTRRVSRPAVRGTRAAVT